MDIFIYSDESGVFDKVHNTKYVFGGVLFLGKEEKDIYTRKYSAAEKTIRQITGDAESIELKASYLGNTYKQKLYRSLNNVYKFGVVIDQTQVFDRIFQNKKTKQRFLDYAYKIAVKRCLCTLMEENVFVASEVENLRFFVDEHTTATDGRYELREGLEEEYKIGTYSMDFKRFYPPIFPDIQRVELKYCNSTSVILVRAADIVANHIYYLATHNHPTYDPDRHLYVSNLP